MRSAPQAPSLALLAVAAACLAARGASALDSAALEKLSSGDASAKLATVQEAVASADVAALPVLRALLEGRLATAADRLRAARTLQEGADEDLLPLLDRVLAQEKDIQVRDAVRSIQGALLIDS